MTARPRRVPAARSSYALGASSSEYRSTWARILPASPSAMTSMSSADRAPVGASASETSYGTREEAERVAAHPDADERHVGERAGDRDRERDGGVDADEVEHEVGAAALRELADLVRRGVAGAARRGARRRPAASCSASGDWSTAMIRVGRDRVEDLDRHVPETAGADDERRRAGDELVERPLDRVVRREPRVGQRRGVDRVEVGERHEVARRSARAAAAPSRRRTRARSPSRRNSARFSQ